MGGYELSRAPDLIVDRKAAMDAIKKRNRPHNIVTSPSRPRLFLGSIPDLACKAHSTPAQGKDSIVIERSNLTAEVMCLVDFEGAAIE